MDLIGNKTPKEENINEVCSRKKPVYRGSTLSDTFIDGTTATFTCSGNVGGPAGWFWWFIVRGSTEFNITDQAHLCPPTTAWNCTSNRVGVLFLDITAALTHGVLRCKVYNPFFAAPSPGCSGLCAESNQLLVIGE